MNETGWWPVVPKDVTDRRTRTRLTPPDGYQFVSNVASTLGIAALIALVLALLALAVWNPDNAPTASIVSGLVIAGLPLVALSAALMLARQQGLYLSRSGVEVRRMFSRSRAAWRDASFEIQAAPGRPPVEWVVLVVRGRPRPVLIPSLSRPQGWKTAASHGKLAKLSQLWCSYDELVHSLNALRDALVKADS